MGLIGLLTYAWIGEAIIEKACNLIFSDYSCGAVADSHRASRASDREIYSRVIEQSQAGDVVCKRNGGESPAQRAPFTTSAVGIRSLLSRRSSAFGIGKGHSQFTGTSRAKTRRSHTVLPTPWRLAPSLRFGRVSSASLVHIPEVSEECSVFDPLLLGYPHAGKADPVPAPPVDF